MARALIVGCGCFGTELGSALAADGWAVRGTSRTAEGMSRVEAAGLEGARADPDRVGTVLEQVSDVAVVIWALAGASGDTAAAVNAPRLERMLERLVDTPVRGFVLDAGPRGAAGAGAGLGPEVRREAIGLVEAAERTWRIPTRVVETPRGGDWTAAMMSAASGLLARA